MSSPVVLVTGGFDHKLRFWEATSGVCTSTITFSETSQVNCVQISPDKTLLAAGGNPLINIYDISGSSANNDDKPILTYSGHSSNVMAVGFQKDLKWLYSCSDDGTIKVWDPRSNKTSRTYDCGCAVNTLVLHPNQSELISGDQNGYLRVWNLEKDACSEEYLPIADMPIRSVSLSCDASILAVGSHRGKVFIYATTEAKNLQLVKEFQAHEDYLLRCVVSPDANSVATASSDKTVKMWSTSTWEVTKTLVSHQKWIWDAVYSADSMYLVTASSDHCGKLWDLSTGEVLRNYIGHSLAVTCVALSD